MYENVDINALLSYAQAGDKQAQDYIVENNMGLVWSAVRKFYGRGYENDDLFQIGCIGLLKAVKKFDMSFEVKFSTYAVPMIIGEIKRFMRDDGIIKVSRSLKELSGKAYAVRDILQKELGHEPSVNDIASRLGVSPEELAVALEAGLTPESIYASTDDGSSTGSSIADKLECPTDYESEIIDKLVIKESLRKFPPRERQIIILRYFHQKTQSQIAEVLGISQVQVSRIEKKVLLELRRKISGDS